MDAPKLAHELNLILIIIERVRASVESRDLESFSANNEAVDAVAYRLAMIGEHCKRLPDAVKTRYAHIPWENMVGLRNIVSHGYDIVDTGIVWHAATRRLEDVRAMCHAELARLQPETE